MSFFKRFTANAQADLERGYSFVGYMLFDTPQQVFEYISESTGIAFEESFELSLWMDENSDLVAQDNETCLWGQRRSGLCGFGAYETIEDAIADDVSYGLGYPVVPVIFEGESVYDFSLDGQDEGVTFRPIRIIEI